MRSLASKTNSIAPGGDYPYGRTQDDTGSGNGTPVNEETHGDFHQFFEKLMADAGVTPNGQPENSATGFQLNEALGKFIILKTKKDQLSFVVSGGGVLITSGLKGHRRVPFACKITGWEITSDQSTSAVVDVWRKVYASLPATNADSIVAGSEPTLSAGIKGQNLALTPINLAEGDYLYYNVDSNTAAQYLHVTLIIERV